MAGDDKPAVGARLWTSVGAVVHVRRVKNATPSTHPIQGDELRALRRLLRGYPFADSDRPSRPREPEPRRSDRGIVGRCRGPLHGSAWPMQPRILRTPDAARYLGLTASTLEKMRLTGAGPRFIRLGFRAVGYAIGDLDAFVDAGRRASTSDPGAAAVNVQGPSEARREPNDTPRKTAPAPAQAARSRRRIRRTQFQASDLGGAGP